MKCWAACLAGLFATAAVADISCAMTPHGAEGASTLLYRDGSEPVEAFVLVAGRTFVFDCPAAIVARSRECYGRTRPPMQAPTQLNIFAERIGPGALVVLTTRNLFFDRKKNARIGNHRRHASVHVFTIETCDRF